MFKSYLKIAFRNITRNSVYSFINIAGLSVGIACSILILLWVNDELSFDKFHTNYNNLYQVYMNRKFTDGVSSQRSLPYPLKETIRNTASNFKHIVITNWGEGNLLTVKEKGLSRLGLSVSDGFLEMFSFDVIEGDNKAPLADVNSIVITESTAKALFGNESAINQLIKIDNNKEVKVTAVIKDVPKQSTFQFDYLFPFSFYEATQEWVRESKDNWENNSFQMYAELQPNVSVEDANAIIQDLVKSNSKEATSAQLFLHPMKLWRLYSNFENGKASGGMIEYVRLFTIIAIFILVIACINFMNLATARSATRAREVGIRKSVGSRRKELIGQFLGESIFITLLSFCFGLLLVEVALPFYNTLVNKQLLINYSDPMIWISAAILILGSGIIAGSYPAFYLSSFQPVKVLKGKIQSGRGGGLDRKILVTLQFSFSILLIVGTVVIYNQIQFVKQRDIGYNRENLMLIWTSNEIETSFQAIKDELTKTGDVAAVCKSNSPITRIFATNTVEWEGMPPGPPVEFTTIATEYDYTSTMGIKLLEGRDFSRDFKSDSLGILVNKTALDMIGFKDPIGQTLKMWGSDFHIIGVMEDVVMGSPYQPIDPLVMVFVPTWTSTITVRLNKTGDLPKAISSVEDVFKKFNPAYPFEYRFADTEFDTKFSTINLISTLATLFASLAIFITCLGLFGLAAFTAEQRTKEIGIRKVMGATVSSLVLLISKDFSRLVIIAFVIAGPLAWWALNDFLERYPYRIEIPWWVLPLAGITALILAIIIVSTQALKAATANPSESLRNE